MRGRLIGLIDDVVRRLTRHSNLTFLLDGQASLIEDYLAVRPERRRAVRRLVASGRLAIGPWYVLADEQLAGDEPLVRNLLLGRATCARLGGWLHVGYSPDAFGHPAALPTILAGFDIEAAVLWRGYGGEPGQEQDLFHWTGPDGARVLVHHLSRDGYEVGAELPARGDALRKRWHTIAADLEPRAAVPVLYVPNGADHHAMQPNIASVVWALSEAASRHEFVIGTPAAYFAAAAPLASDVPTVAGELRFSYRYTWTLQGVTSTRARLKGAIARGASTVLRWAEPQTALAALEGGHDARPVLRDVWREHLRNLSHDTLAGTVIDRVAEDAGVRARHVIEAARGIADRAIARRLGQDPTRARRAGRAAWDPALIIVNPSATAREGVLEATITRYLNDVVVGRPVDAGRDAAAGAFHLVSPDGTVVPHQVLYAYDGYDRLDASRAYPDQDRVRAVRVAVESPAVPALGLLRLAVVPGYRAPGVPSVKVSASGASLLSGWTRVEAEPSGGFRVRFGDGDTLHDAVHLESERDRGDTYTFEPVAGDAPLGPTWHRPRVLARGPLIGAIARDFALGDRARGTVHVRLDASSALVRVIVEGENLAGGHRLRVGFPLPRDADHAVADMLYGPTTRSLERFDPTQFPKEWPVSTAPMHRYVSAGGLTVFARDRCEYELTPHRMLWVTILRGVSELSRDDLGARPGHAAWPTSTPDAEERGPFRVELALASLAIEEGMAAARWAEVERLAEEFHAPLGGWMLRWGISVPKRVEGPALDGEGFAFKTMKPREDEDGIVLRAVNVTRGTCEGAWRWPTPIRRAYRARLDETVLEELPLDEMRHIVRFTAAPREVVTVIVEV